MKVKRLSDNKIFSSPEAAAASYGKKSAKYIIYCADGYLKEVEESKWEWVIDESVKLPYKKITYKDREKFCYLSSKREIYFFMMYIDRWLKSQEDLMIISLPNLSKELNASVYANTGVENRFDARGHGIVQLLVAWGDILKTIFGMSKSGIRNPNTRKMITCLIFDKSKISTPVNFDALEYELDAIFNRYAKVKTRKNSKSIILIETSQHFSSIREANIHTGVSRKQISWNCKGDIEFVYDKQGNQFHFEYAK